MLNNLKKGELIVFAAPSGAGKSSLIKEIISNNENIELSVSATTRSPREGEIHGKDYFFTDSKHFESMIYKDQFIEYQCVYGNLYGSTKEYVLNQLDEGHDVILEIDYKGMMKIKSIYPEAITIYIVPPCIDSLRERLISRAQDDHETVENRISSARFELCYAQLSDYVIINGNFRSALVDLAEIVLVNKLSKL